MWKKKITNFCTCSFDNIVWIYFDFTCSSFSTFFTLFSLIITAKLEARGRLVYSRVFHTIQVTYLKRIRTRGIMICKIVKRAIFTAMWVPGLTGAWFFGLFARVLKISRCFQDQIYNVMCVGILKTVSHTWRDDCLLTYSSYQRDLFKHKQSCTHTYIHICNKVYLCIYGINCLYNRGKFIRTYCLKPLAKATLLFKIYLEISEYLMNNVKLRQSRTELLVPTKGSNYALPIPDGALR